MPRTQYSMAKMAFMAQEWFLVHQKLLLGLWRMCCFAAKGVIENISSYQKLIIIWSSLGNMETTSDSSRLLPAPLLRLQPYTQKNKERMPLG